MAYVTGTFKDAGLSLINPLHVESRGKPFKRLTVDPLPSLNSISTTSTIAVIEGEVQEQLIYCI